MDKIVQKFKHWIEWKLKTGQYAPEKVRVNKALTRAEHHHTENCKVCGQR